VEGDLLETVVGAAKLQGEVEYNLRLEPGSVQARSMICAQYRRDYKPLLAPHRDSPVIAGIMDFFDQHSD